MPQETPFHGETICQMTTKSTGNPCNNNAYFSIPSISADVVTSYVCGIHSKKLKNIRIELQKNPNSRRRRLEIEAQYEIEVEDQAELNRKADIRGSLFCSKLRMMKKPYHITGVRNVFPNFKHGVRSDGFGCKTLSPKDMGPVVISQDSKNDIFSHNIENFHQFNKFFQEKETFEEFVETRINGYNDTFPHRHKFKGVGNQPTCALFPCKNTPPGRDMYPGFIEYNYIESRFLYCHYYEEIAQSLPEFIVLKEMLDNGYNLQIIGYDGFDVGIDEFQDGSCTENIEILWQHYLNGSRPFGHELVLYTLLMIEDRTNFPWNRYYIEHFDELYYHFPIRLG
ncbi:MAG: hypothetical protein JKX76_01370 [Colwellia sp.]|nr:hypothetical protein [Colwellia sp.]